MANDSTPPSKYFEETETVTVEEFYLLANLFFSQFVGQILNLQNFVKILNNVSYVLWVQLLLPNNKG